MGFWQDRRVLVTGATGFVGSHIVPTLIQAGAEVVCLVRDWVPQSPLVRTGFLNQARVVRGDVTDQTGMERTLGEYEIQTVIHLAAQTIVPIANLNAVSTFETNVRGTYLLLEACRRSPKVQQIIAASSDKAYGSHRDEDLPYREQLPLQGRYPYDCSKSCMDLICQCYAASYKLPIMISRCGNFYGPGDLNWNRIVPGTIRSVIRDQRPVIRSDGQYFRDYFYVGEAARAYMFLAEKLAERPELSGQGVNFSSEQEISVLGLVQAILRELGSDLEPEIRGEASNEIRRQCLSANLAKELLGWQPQWSLVDGLRDTIAWYRAHLAEAPGYQDVLTR